MYVFTQYNSFLSRMLIFGKTSCFLGPTHFWNFTTELTLISVPMQTLVEEMLSFESQNGKYDRTCVNCGKSVACWQYKDIFDTVLVWGVVTSKRDNWTESQAVWKENLIRCIQPHLRFTELYQLKHIKFISYIWISVKAILIAQISAHHWYRYKSCLSLIIRFIFGTRKLVFTFENHFFVSQKWTIGLKQPISILVHSQSVYM